MDPKLWWYVARASGIVAWALAAAAVLWGLFLSTRALGRRPPAPWLLDLHRFLGALTVIFVGLHLSALVADNYTHWGLSDVLVPLATRWHPVPVAVGIVAFYLLLAVEATSLVMKRLPRRLWRTVHYASFAVYFLATIHLLTAGTDRRVVELQWAALASSVAVVFFTVYRILAPSKRFAPARAPAGPLSDRAASRIPAGARQYAAREAGTGPA